jgi:4-amino-4-deoxy-L-arabinose transferase-like glycosyltransferase
LILLVLALLIASFLRFYRLASIPPGILGDEAVTAWLATRILRGEGHSVFFAEAWGRMPMQVYLEAALFRVAGVSLHTARSASVLAGVVTVIVLYVFVRTTFGSHSRRATPLPLLSSLLLAVSYWHLVYSRFAADPVLLPLFATSVSLLVWRAIESEPLIWSVLAGLLLGISVYSYPPAAFLPLVFLSFLAYRALTDRARWKVYLAKTIVIFSVAFVVAIPLGRYALNHPDAFFARTRDVSVLNPDLNQGSPLRAVLVSAIKTAAMFSFQGEPDWARNPAGRPVLDPIASAIFLVGLVVAMLRLRQPRYFFVVLWLVVMSLPGVLTAQEIPNWNRTVGVAPAVCILVAIGIDALWERFKTWRVSLWEQRLFWLCVAIFLLWTGISTFRDFFTTWRAPEDLEPVFVETADVMNQRVMSDAIWILPINSGVDPWASEPTIEYLYTGSIPHWYLSVDEATAARDLATVCNRRTTVLLINWIYGVPVSDTFGPVAFADPKELLPFLLTKYGQTSEELEFDNVRVLVHELRAGVSFSIADDFQPMNVQFGEELALLGAAMGGASQNATTTPQEVNNAKLPSGRSGWAVLRWKAVSPPSRDYKVGVYLVDQRGRRVAQADKVLLSNRGQPTSQWGTEQEEIDYYTLPTLAGTPPGWYDIQVAVYNQETMERLPVLNEMRSVVGQTATVGRLQVVTPLHPAVVQPAQTLADSEASVAPDIRLLGYDIPTTTLHPGDTLSVALYWKALRSVHGEYVMTVQLNDQHGRVWAEERGGPVYGTYPTTEWAPGEVLRDWHDLSLDPETPSGGYELMLRVTERGKVSSEISLGAVEVSGRARQFQIPEMQHALGVSLGDQVALLGYNLRTDQVHAGETVGLTLYWQALTEIDVSYTVFTHLLDRDDRIWGQQDSMPGGGQLPTTSWIPGEIIEDDYEIEVSGQARAADYLLEIGMYHWATGRRLPVLDGHGAPQGDRVLLGTVKIIP